MTSLSSSPRPLAQCAVVVSPKDNVAVVKTGLAAGDLVVFPDGTRLAISAFGNLRILSPNAMLSYTLMCG